MPGINIGYDTEYVYGELNEEVPTYHNECKWDGHLLREGFYTLF
jgi:hypothetical protein